MQYSRVLSILAYAIVAEAAAIVTPLENTSEVSAPGRLFKRADSTLDVYNSGSPQSATGGNNLSVNPPCGKVQAYDIDGHLGLCSVKLTGSFSGCPSCEWYGDVGRYKIVVATACANAHIQAGVNTDGEGAGDIGENINSRDCNNKAGGGTRTVNLCAGSNWTLNKC